MRIKELSENRVVEGGLVGAEDKPPPAHSSTFRVVVYGATGLPVADKDANGAKTSSDPFCRVVWKPGAVSAGGSSSMKRQVLVKSEVITACLNPVWGDVKAGTGIVAEVQLPTDEDELLACLTGCEIVVEVFDWDSSVGVVGGVAGVHDLIGGIALSDVDLLDKARCGRVTLPLHSSLETDSDAEAEEEDVPSAPHIEVEVVMEEALKAQLVRFMADRHYS